MSRARPSVVALASLLAPAVALAQEVTIQHDALSCAVAESFPAFEARIEPAERLSRALLHFRPQGGRYWYSVAMKHEGDVFRGVMPKPRRSLKSFSYYIEAMTVDFATSRTKEYAPQVVGTPAACGQGLLATALSAASLVVEAPIGAPAIPAGFSSSGVTTVAAGGAAAGAATGAAGGTVAAGGVSTGLLVGVAGGAAAVAGIVIAAGKGGSSGSSPAQGSSSGGTPAPPATGSGTPTAPPTDLTGTWAGTSPDGLIQTAGGCAGQQEDLLVNLTQSGTNLSGTYDAVVRLAAPGCAPAGTHALGTLSGTYLSGNVSLTSTGTQPPPPAQADSLLTGTVAGKRMSGTFQYIGRNGAGTWSLNQQ